MKRMFEYSVVDYGQVKRTKSSGGIDGEEGDNNGILSQHRNLANNGHHHNNGGGGDKLHVIHLQQQQQQQQQLLKCPVCLWPANSVHCYHSN